ncbi:MAG TPA: GNAT family N-acetyltransferase [Streptomyces sp.]|nr:GNAT family N-acetyltransferase [Streptomyces sp.]
MAGPDDAAEVVRLRRLMFLAMHGHVTRGQWERDAEAMARRQLTGRPGSGEPRLGAFVVEGDEPGVGHLAACAIGTVEERLPAPTHPSGRFGFIFNVCTDPRYRGRGYARSTTEALLEWFTAQGVRRVDLHATEGAERLYRALGFSEHSTALSLDLSRRG